MNAVTMVVEKEIIMEYKLLFLDIDGTILMPDHTYSHSTKDAIITIEKSRN